MKIHALFLSDLHLGSYASNTEFILQVLKKYEPRRIILNGDVFGLDTLNNWNQQCDDILRLLFKRSRDGCEIIYIPGNHDDAVRKFLPLHLGNIHVVSEYQHVTVTGDRILFFHGDAFDLFVLNNSLITHIGSWLYECSILVNRGFNALRSALGLPYWSLSSYLKRAAKKRTGLLNMFDQSVVSYAQSRGFDQVCVGHIHIPEIRMLDGVRYLNTGDLCESNSYILELLTGELVLRENQI